MNKKYTSRHEYINERMVDWLADFADEQGNKIVKSHNITPEEIKEAGHIENILQIVERRKQQSVEEKVEHYRQLVGLDMVNSLSKEGEQDSKKEVKASRLPLSSRDKTAQDTQAGLLNKIKVYVDQLIKNRNGAIATPAIFDQIETYFQVDKDWLRERYDQLHEMIEKSRKEFSPAIYDNIPVDQLAKTELPDKKEPPLFTQPPSPQGG